MARQPRYVQGGYTAGTSAQNYMDASLAQHLASNPSTIAVCWMLRALNADGTQRQYAQLVRWDAYPNYTIDAEGTLTKTSAVGWTDSAYSLSGTHPGTRATIQCLAARTYGTIGFTTDRATRNAGTNAYAAITFGVLTDNSNSCQIVVNGASVGSGGTLASYDTLEVEIRTDGSGQFRINGVAVYTTATGLFPMQSYYVRLTGYAQSVAPFLHVTIIRDALLGFTSHTKNLTLPGHGTLQFSSRAGLKPTNADAREGLSASQMEVDAIFAFEGINEESVSWGAWDAGTYESFIVNYKATGMGEMVMQSGLVGEIVSEGPTFKAEGLGTSSVTSQQVGEVTLPTCRARDFGDARCGLTLLPGTHIFTGAATSSTDAVTLIDSARTEATGFYDNGKVRFTSGPLTGKEVEIATYTNTGGVKTFALQEPLPYAVFNRVKYTATRGCKRTPAACEGYGNKINYQGEDTIPGLEAVHTITR